ncbi:hypothetical protein PVAP13_8NG150801 [Panicum virgatum]|uniref:F-box domain-containing protein n=1 Tax=Panicum virgatum TaxID=38727 RepID=A0A8T0PE86_PANVG|nr:hypothetical protein PVAP13_8NG150801 [Panicum virgatum]
MAAPQPRSWAGLATAHLHEILARVPCPADRHRARLACRAWRAAAGDLPPPPPPRALPWLLLPTPYPAGSTRVACVLSGCRVHHYLAITPRARCFGSHDGAWLFLHLREPRGHQLLNVPAGDIHVLPTVLRDPFVYPRGRNMVFLVAALSAPPEDPLCVLAGIVASWADGDDDDPHPDAAAAAPPRQRRLVLWIMERQEALDIGSGSMAEDVVYHDDAFLFLTKNDNLRVATPVQYHDGDLDVHREVRLFRHPGGRGYEQLVRARYLVVSRGELLMVARIKPRPQEPWTSAYKVFLGTKRQVPDADPDRPMALYTHAWSELDTLGGRMLFVGRGCSRSYEVDQYPGFKEGIYFLDDGEFYDEAVIFADGGERQFRCSDNGRWSQGHVQRCFPRPDPSDHCFTASYFERNYYEFVGGLTQAQITAARQTLPQPNRARLLPPATRQLALLSKKKETAGFSSAAFQKGIQIPSQRSALPVRIPCSSSNEQALRLAPTPPRDAMDAPPRKSLQDLHMDTQRLILSRITWSVDRGRVSLVCRAWRDMVRSHRHTVVGRRLPLPRPLPRLLLRAPIPAVGSARAVCVLSGCRAHHYLAIVPPDARCFGSHDGAWLLLDSRGHVHRPAAVNARTSAVRNRPRELLRRADPHVYRMVIHAAALSSSPDDADCVGAAIARAWRNAAPGAAAASRSGAGTGRGAGISCRPAKTTSPWLWRTSSTSTTVERSPSSPRENTSACACRCGFQTTRCRQGGGRSASVPVGASTTSSSALATRHLRRGAARGRQVHASS